MSASSDPYGPPLPDGKFLVLTGGECVELEAVAHAVARRDPPALVLEGLALLASQPRPVDADDAARRLARVLPGVLHALTREGHRLVIFVHRFTAAAQIDAVRRAAARVLPHTQVRRPVYTVSEMRKHLKGPEAERNFAKWAHTHRVQEEQAQSGDMGEPVALGTLGIEGAADFIAQRGSPPPPN